MANDRLERCHVSKHGSLTWQSEVAGGSVTHAIPAEDGPSRTNQPRLSNADLVGGVGGAKKGKKKIKSIFSPGVPEVVFFDILYPDNGGAAKWFKWERLFPIPYF